MVIVTVSEGISKIVACIKAGATDFVNKPWNNQELEAIVSRAAYQWELSTENLHFRLQSRETGRESIEILGTSAVTVQIREQIPRLASLDSNVLISGGPGVGKALAARAIHAASSRSQGRLVMVSCPGKSFERLEQELFGVENGFPAQESLARPGKLELSSNGTLLLLHVEKLPPQTQVSLEKAIAAHESRRLGKGSRSIPLNLRIIGTTRADLAAEAKCGVFHEALYWRLASAALRIPPLSERREDVLALLTRFVAGEAQWLEVPEPALDPSLLAALEKHPFNAGVKELKDLAHCLVHAANGSRALDISALPLWILAQAPREAEEEGPLPLDEVTSALEKQLVVNALRVCDENATLTARRLGISRAGLFLRLKRLGIPLKKERRKMGKVQGNDLDHQLEGSIRIE